MDMDSRDIQNQLAKSSTCEVYGSNDLRRGTVFHRTVLRISLLFSNFYEIQNFSQIGDIAKNVDSLFWITIGSKFFLLEGEFYSQRHLAAIINFFKISLQIAPK